MHPLRAHSVPTLHPLCTWQLEIYSAELLLSEHRLRVAAAARSHAASTWACTLTSNL